MRSLTPGRNTREAGGKATCNEVKNNVRLLARGPPAVRTAAGGSPLSEKARPDPERGLSALAGSPCAHRPGPEKAPLGRLFACMSSVLSCSSHLPLAGAQEGHTRPAKPVTGHSWHGADGGEGSPAQGRGKTETLPQDPLQLGPTTLSQVHQ